MADILALLYSMLQLIVLYSVTHNNVAILYLVLAGSHFSQLPLHNSPVYAAMELTQRLHGEEPRVDREPHP